MQLTSAKAQFAAEFLDIEQAAQVPGAFWEPFQLHYLSNEARLAIDVKSRQIAWSFTAALDAVVDGILNENTPHLFISINLSEAKEKIRYARAIINALDSPVRPRLLRENQTELEFANGSRLISHPCNPTRGKAKARIYLDEMAHYKEGMDQEIYLAALPATTKGGYIRIGSSTLGAKGLFWEIATQSLREWPGFLRDVIPWWRIRSLCKDVPGGREHAPGMPTEDRVYTYGTEALIEIFENMFLEDFQQEYECLYVDESTAWITWEVIKRNQQEDLLWYHASSVDEALALIPEIQEAISKRLIEPVLVGGIDVGRKKNLTELVGLGKAAAGHLPLRLGISLSQVEYDDQESCFREILTQLPFSQCLVDRNGIGAQLAENLERTGRAQGVDFTNPSKELWAVEARIQAERAHTPLPREREYAYQIHSIKKKVTAAKNNVFDTERNEKHHADKFWAWALAIYTGANPGVIVAPNPFYD